MTTRNDIIALINRLSRTYPAYQKLLAELERDGTKLTQLESLQATTPLELIRLLERN